MSGDSTGQVLGATTTATGVAVLPATGDSAVMQAVVIAIIAVGVLVTLSFTATRAYRKFAR